MAFQWMLVCNFSFMHFIHIPKCRNGNRTCVGGVGRLWYYSCFDLTSIDDCLWGKETITGHTRIWIVHFQKKFFRSIRITFLQFYMKSIFIQFLRLHFFLTTFWSKLTSLFPFLVNTFLLLLFKLILAFGGVFFGVQYYWTVYSNI